MEPSSGCLESLDSAVEAFAHGVGNFVSKVGKEAFDVTLKATGDLDHWRKL